MSACSYTAIRSGYLHSPVAPPRRKKTNSSLPTSTACADADTSLQTASNRTSCPLIYPACDDVRTRDNFMKLLPQVPPRRQNGATKLGNDVIDRPKRLLSVTCKDNYHRNGVHWSYNNHQDNSRGPVALFSPLSSPEDHQADLLFENDRNTNKFLPSNGASLTCFSATGHLSPETRSHSEVTDSRCFQCNDLISNNYHDVINEQVVLPHITSIRGNNDVIVNHVTSNNVTVKEHDSDDKFSSSMTSTVKCNASSSSHLRECSNTVTAVDNELATIKCRTVTNELSSQGDKFDSNNMINNISNAFPILSSDERLRDKLAEKELSTAVNGQQTASEANNKSDREDEFSEYSRNKTKLVGNSNTFLSTSHDTKPTNSSKSRERTTAPSDDASTRKSNDWNQGDLMTYCSNLLAWQQRYRQERMQRRQQQLSPRQRNRRSSQNVDCSTIEYSRDIEESHDRKYRYISSCSDNQRSPNEEIKEVCESIDMASDYRDNVTEYISPWRPTKGIISQPNNINNDGSRDHQDNDQLPFDQTYQSKLLSQTLHTEPVDTVKSSLPLDQISVPTNHKNNCDDGKSATDSKLVIGLSKQNDGVQHNTGTPSIEQTTQDDSIDNDDVKQLDEHGQHMNHSLIAGEKRAQTCTDLDRSSEIIPIHEDVGPSAEQEPVKILPDIQKSRDDVSSSCEPSEVSKHSRLSSVSGSNASKLKGLRIPTDQLSPSRPTRPNPVNLPVIVSNKTAVRLCTAVLPTPFKPVVTSLVQQDGHQLDTIRKCQQVVTSLQKQNGDCHQRSVTMSSSCDSDSKLSRQRDMKVSWTTSRHCLSNVNTCSPHTFNVQSPNNTSPGSRQPTLQHYSKQRQSLFPIWTARPFHPTVTSLMTSQHEIIVAGETGNRFSLSDETIKSCNECEESNVKPTTTYDCNTNSNVATCSQNSNKTLVSVADVNISNDFSVKRAIGLPVFPVSLDPHVTCDDGSLTPTVLCEKHLVTSPQTTKVDSESANIDIQVDDVIKEVMIIKGAFGVGFCIEGGIDCLTGPAPIRVKRVFRADDVIQQGDEIVSVNGSSYVNMSHFEAWKHLKSISPGHVTFQLRRK